MELDNTQEVQEESVIVNPPILPLTDVEASAKTIEQDILKEEEAKLNAKAASATSEDLAAVLFRLYGPKFYQGIDRLNLKALRRVIKKLVTYPLNTKELKPQTNLEKEVFGIGDRLLEAKYVMIMGTYARNKDIAKALEDKVEEVEQLNKEKGESANVKTLDSQNNRVSSEVERSEQTELHQVQTEGQ